MTMIDRDGPDPPYRQIAAFLRARITSGELPPGARLPAVQAVMDEYGVARATARKAMRVLADEGLARVVTGWGTYVAPR